MESDVCIVCKCQFSFLKMVSADSAIMLFFKQLYSSFDLRAESIR